MKKWIVRPLAILLCMALLFGMVPLAVPAKATGNDGPHFQSGSYSCKEGESVSIWFESDLPTLSCDWSFSDPDAFEITAELSNLSNVSIYNDEVSYFTMLQLSALKAGIHTVTANITTSAGFFSISTTVAVDATVRVTFAEESVKCLVNEECTINLEAVCSLGGVDYVNVIFSDEEAATVTAVSALGGGPDPYTGEPTPCEISVMLCGHKVGDYTVTLELQYGSLTVTYETKLHVMEEVRSGKFGFFGISGNTVYIDDIPYTVAVDCAMGDGIRELTSADDKTVVFSVNSDGEVNKIYMAEDLCYPSVSLSADPTALTYSTYGWNDTAMQVTATLRWARKAGAPFTDESLKRAGLCFQVDELRLSIDSDAMNFYSTGGLFSKDIRAVAFDHVPVYYGSYRSETVTVHITDGYVPKNAVETVYITPTVTSQWSDMTYTCAPVCVTLGNTALQAEQAAENKSRRQAEQAAQMLEKIQLMQDRTVLLYDGAMAQWFTEEQYENINNFLLLYMGWLLAVEKETIPDQILGVQSDYIQMRLRQILGVDTAYQYLMDNILGLRVNKINSEILVQALNKDGKEVFITFKVSLPNYSGSGGVFGALGSIQYSISGPRPAGAYTNGGTRGLTYLNFDAFAELVLDYIASASNAAWGENADKVASMLVSESVEMVTGGCYADRMFTLGRVGLKNSMKKYSIKCPVDVYVCDMTGTQVGAVVDNRIVEGGGDVLLAVSGEEKHVYLTGDTYAIRLVGTGAGTMDYTVEEYAGHELTRTVETLDVPLTDGCVYTALAPEQPNVEQELYSLEAEDETVIRPDSDTAERSFEETVTVADSGSCGSGVSWTLYSNGLLEIYGNGEMDDYNTYTTWPPYMSEDVRYVLIRDGVTRIGAYAFSEYTSAGDITWNQNIKAIAVADSVEEIGHYAFYKCSNLQEVYLGSGVTAIGSWAFSYDENLTAIAVSEDNPSYKSVDGALYSKDGSVLLASPRVGVENWEIPQGVTTIGPDAVGDHGTLESVTIPASVTRIEDSAFDGCAKLEEIHFEGDCPFIASNAFDDVTATVYIPDGNETWTLEKRTDYGGDLTWPTGELPEEERIRVSGTWGDSLEWRLTAGGRLEISGTGDMAEFENNSWEYPWQDYQYDINALVIESGVTSIAKNAFEDCVYLAEVTLGDTVEEIGQEAFRGCENLKNVLLPFSVSQVGMDAFEDCYLLSGVTVLNPDCAVEWFYNSDTLGSVGRTTVHGCAGSAVQLLAEYAGYQFTAHTFADEVCTVCGCSQSLYSGQAAGICGRDLSWNLSEDGVLTIRGQGDMYTYQYMPWDAYADRIIRIVMEPGVTGISDDAFAGLWNLNGVEIPETVKEIGSGAFKHCPSLRTVTVPDGVERICGSAFWNCIALETVYLGATVESIEYDAFESCGELRGIFADENNPYFSSDGEGTLFNKERTVLRKVPSTREGSFSVPQGVQMIAPYALESCDSLTSVTVCEGVADIGEYAFYNCRSVTDLQLPDSVDSIGESAFSGCTSLRVIALLDGIGEIPYGLFSHCSSLAQIIIPNSVTAIGRYAFDQCSSLSSITIPAEVASIGLDAFRDCTSLTEITFLGDAPTFADEVFESVTATACYPAGNATWTADVMQDYGGTITWTTGERASLAAPAVSVTNVASSGKIKLTWNAVDGAASYKVYRSTSKDGTYTLLKTVTGTTFTNTGAVAGSTYYYYVVAAAEDGTESEASAIVARTCDLARPSISLSSVVSSGKIKVSWEKIDGAVKYQVYRSTTGQSGSWTLMKTTTGTSYTNTSAKAGTRYYYRVRAVAEKSAANSAYSPYKYRVCDLPQPVVTVSNVASSGKIKVAWEAVEGAVSYRVYRATSSGGTYTLLKTTTSTSFTNTSAKAGTTYYYKVVAVHSNSSANSAYSAYKSRTCDLARPSVSITLKSGKPRLTWTAIDGAVSYKVYRATSKNGTYSLVKTTTSNSYTNTGAKSGVTYYYKVIAVHSRSAANSAYSLVDSIKSK